MKKLHLITLLQQMKYPALLLGLCMLAYGLYFRWFGFYGDDWSYVWYRHLIGFGGPGTFASIDRPFSGLFYNPVMAVLGEQALPYHIFNLILRWISGCLFFSIIKRIAPDKPGLAAWAGILFVLYPGFTQQPIAVEFILHFFVLDLFLLSILLMLWSVGKSGFHYWVLTLLSMLAAASLFLSEYFIGLEAARPVLLFFVLGRTSSKIATTIKKIVKAWLPTLIVVVGFLYWRVFVFKFPTYQPQLVEEFTADPFSAITGLALQVVIDLKAVLIDAWRQVLIAPVGKREMFYMLAMILVSLVLVYLFWLKSVKDENTQVVTRSAFWRDTGFYPILFSLYLLLIAGWPFWITHIPIRIDFPWDRSILPFLPGLSILIAGVLELIFRKPYHVLVLGVMVGLSLFFHYQNAKEYRYEWEKMRQFFWQLSWRAPALESGTVLVSDDIPLYRHSDNNLNAPLNWTYAPALTSMQLPYKFFDLFLRMDPQYNEIPSLKEGIPITHNYRRTTFESSTSALLAYYQDPDMCVRLLGPDDSTIWFLPEKVANAAKISKLERVLPEIMGQAVPPNVFLPEPAHGWCYIFQKADLAFQNKDYETVTSLYEESLTAGLSPQDPTELLPFLKAYAALGNSAEAEKMVDTLLSDPVNRPVLCAHLDAFVKASETQKNVSITKQLFDYAGCDPK